MYGADYYQDDFHQMLQSHRQGASRRFDEYYRCYPVVMLRGPERDDLEYGGKIIMPPSALEKLTRLHITYPMLFELINGQKQRTTHCGVLEFIAEEGKLYLPHWMMQTLLLETGDLIQIKSTDLPSASLVKLQPQSTNFLDISDPKAVLEKAFRNFATLTKGDVFSFKYNDTIYSVEALEVKPVTEKMGVSMLETDVSVDFAPPVGYIEPKPNRPPRAATAQNHSGLGRHNQQGTMAQAINYSSIAPPSDLDLTKKSFPSSNFLSGGHKLNPKKNAKTQNSTKPTPPLDSVASMPRTNSPQPLRLPPNQLFFGFEIKPVAAQGKENSEGQPSRFEGMGKTLRAGARKD
ncbi:hypothetical protein K3495_g8617 [Podosphaera aphanis]|nr:hypothetical protein K3495_g8617 [Podosphaera aphanis]